MNIYAALKKLQPKSIRYRALAGLWIALMLLTAAVTGCAGGDQGAGSGQDASEAAAAMPFSDNSVVFEIVPAESEARFLIDEILRGEPKRVVGTSNQVSGQIGVDFADPAKTAVGPIQVDARTLETDNGFRNRAIQNRILLSGIYEFVTFTPTAIRGLPAAIAMGEAVELEIDGDLTITTITRPATFAVTVIPLSETRLQGNALTTIQRDDFDLVIPSATGVAAVGEEVTLKLDFTAAAVK